MNDPVHIVIRHKNSGYDIMRTYLSITERTNYPYLLTIMDDGSDKNDDGYKFLQYLASIESLDSGLSIIFNEKEMGSNWCYNQLFFELHDRTNVVVIGQSVEIQSRDWLKEMINVMKDINVGSCGAISVDHDWVTVVSSGKRLIVDEFDYSLLKDGKLELLEHVGSNRLFMPSTIKVDCVPFECVMYNRKALNQMGKIISIGEFFGDCTISMELLRLGYDNICIPQVGYFNGAIDNESYEIRQKKINESESKFMKTFGFSPLDPVSYWDDIKKNYEKTNILWRYEINA